MEKNNSLFQTKNVKQELKTQKEEKANHKINCDINKNENENENRNKNQNHLDNSIKIQSILNNSEKSLDLGCDLDLKKKIINKEAKDIEANTIDLDPKTGSESINNFEKVKERNLSKGLGFVQESIELNSSNCLEKTEISKELELNQNLECKPK